MTGRDCSDRLALLDKISTQALPVLYRRNEEFILRRIGGDTLLVPLRQETSDRTRVYLLNELGARLWETFQKPAGAAAAAAELAEEYDAPQGRIAEDAASFAAQMEGIGALIPVSRA